MEIAWRTSFRGRTKWGYANWSLNGGNEVRLNLNVLWAATVELVDRAVQAAVARGDRPAGSALGVGGAREDVFAYLVAGTAGHEILHLELHQVLDVRRAGRRAGRNEARIHHAALDLVDELLLR